MATSRKVPKHHFIPRFLLRNFTHKKGNHHLLLADKSSGAFKKQGVKISFQRPGLYTWVGLDEDFERTGESSDDAEKFLCTIESKAGKVVKQIVDCKNKDELQKYVDNDPEGMKDLAVFHHIQFKRNVFMHIHMSRLHRKENITVPLEQLIKSNAQRADKLADIVRSVIFERISTEEEIEKLKKQHIAVVYIDTTNGIETPEINVGNAFVTGNVAHAIICRNPQHLALWLPVSPKIAIRVIEGRSRHHQVCRASRSLVKSINRFIFEGSDEIAVQSEFHFTEIKRLRALKYKKYNDILYYACQYDNSS